MSAPTSSALKMRIDECPCKGCETARRQEAAKWQAAIQRVREIHKPEAVSDYISHQEDGLCEESSCDMFDCEFYEGDWCHTCDEKAPCATVRALDGEQA